MEDKMDFQNAVKEVFLGQTDAAKAGLSQAVGAEVEEAMVDVLYDMLPSIPEFMRAGWVRDYVLPQAISSGLLLACKLLPGKLPKATMIERLAYAAAVQKWQEISRPLTKYVRRYVTALVGKLQERGLGHLVEEEKAE